jgi:hypothetical protein
MIELIRPHFPRFVDRVEGFELENVLPGASPEELAALEVKLAVPLPSSYKQLLLATRGFWLMGGVVQFGEEHLFLHEFPALEALSPPQLRSVKQKGGTWPPPSNGMLCFAEFWMEADGDQVLFDVSRGLVDGEYPVMYYSHEGRPPSVRKLADNFVGFMEKFLEYEEFQR